MKSGYNLFYTPLCFRGFVHFSYPETEYIADTINFRKRSFKLIVEKLTLTLERLNPKYSQLSIRTKVNININQRNSK